MVWGRLDDKARGNAKLRAVGKTVRGGLWFVWNYASEQGTNGWAPAWVVEQEMTAKEIRAAIDVRANGRAGLLHKWGEKDDCSCLVGVKWTDTMGGYWVHDWLDYNPSKSETSVRRAKKRELDDMDLRHLVKMRDGNSCRYCGVIVPWNDNRSPHRLTIDHVNPLLAAGAENLVVACMHCNTTKSDASSPEAAGLTLLPPPVEGTVPLNGWPKGTDPATVVRRPEPTGTEPTGRPTDPPAVDHRSIDRDTDRDTDPGPPGDPQPGHDPAPTTVDQHGPPATRPAGGTAGGEPPGTGRDGQGGRKPVDLRAGDAGPEGRRPVIGPPDTPRTAAQPSPYRRGATSNIPVPGKPSSAPERRGP